MNDVALHLKGIAHRYAKNWVLADIHLTAPTGSATALCGSNGSGKSTLLKIIATRINPTKGSGTIFGLDLEKEKETIRKKVEWLGHELGLYKALTPLENLKFALEMRGDKKPEASILQALERVGLLKEARQPVRTFSTGMMKRLALARILLQNPSLILLDEPHANLDKEGKLLMDQCLIDWKKSGVTLLCATHEEASHKNIYDAIFTLPDSALP